MTALHVAECLHYTRQYVIDFNFQDKEKFYVYAVYVNTVNRTSVCMIVVYITAVHMTSVRMRAI